MKSPPRLIEDAASVYASHVKKLDQQIKKASKNQIDDYLMKEMLRNIKESAKTKVDEAPEDTIFKYCVAVTSNRYFLRLKNRRATEKDLIGFVTHCQHQKALFMLFAMKEPSRFSIMKVYTSQSASRAYARTVCPIVLFIAILLFKTAISMGQNAYKESKKEFELNKRFVTFKKEIEAFVDMKIGQLESKMRLGEKD